MASIGSRIRLAMALFTLLVTQHGCYEQSARLPAPEAPLSGPEVAESAGTTSPDGPSNRAQLAATIKVVTHKLGEPGEKHPPEQRPGAGKWRAAELEKLKEVLSDCCRGEAEACRRCVEPIARQGLPSDELWPLIGQFLGPLRTHAELGLISLGAPLFTHEEGQVRDRIYRMAVAAGVSRRGQPDAESRRAATIPLVPRLGQPVWLMVEQMTACPDIEGDVKGPDRSGRLDLVLTDSCTQAQWDAVTNTFPPRATRGVWAVKIEAMPMAGITLWMGGADKALLHARPGLDTSSEVPQSP